MMLCCAGLSKKLTAELYSGPSLQECRSSRNRERTSAAVISFARRNKEEMTCSSKKRKKSLLRLHFVVINASKSKRKQRKRYINQKAVQNWLWVITLEWDRAPLFTHKKATSARLIIFKRITSPTLTEVLKTAVLFPAYCWCHTRTRVRKKT